jgi:hypothetical protein
MQEEQRKKLRRNSSEKPETTAEASLLNNPHEMVRAENKTTN